VIEKLRGGLITHENAAIGLKVVLWKTLLISKVSNHTRALH